MSKKYRTDNIPSGNYDEDWGGSATNTIPSETDETNELPYSGEAVQKFIKDSLQRCEGKVGYFKWSQSTDSSNYYHLQGFASEETYKEYNAGDKTDEKIQALLLLDEPLPISTVQGDSYGAYLYSKVSASANIVVADGKLQVPLRFCAVRTLNGERLNMGNKGTLVVQRKTNSTSWTTVATLTDALASTDYLNTEEYTTIDLGSYLASGSQNIRVQARFEYEDGEGKTQTQSSVYVMIGASVVCSQLSITCTQDWQTPIQASTQQANGFPYSYTVYGAVDKTLHLQITGGNNSVLSIEKELDNTKNGTTIRETYIDATDSFKLFKHGVRLVKAWLTCEDGLGNTITSNVLENRFMVVNFDTAGVDKTKPYVMLQNIASMVANYAQEDVCSFAVYSPKVNEDGGVTNEGKEVNVVFYLTDYTETFPKDDVTQYFRIEQSVEPGVINSLNTTIEIETEESSDRLTAYFRMYRRDGEDEVEALADATGSSVLGISVDNSGSYAPTSGATFVLNPKIRNNTETNPQRILNSKDNSAEVESTWTGFDFVNDGWVTAEDGVKVLRIPAGTTLNFKYNPFAQFVSTPNSSMTLELDVAMRNVVNEKDPIIQICEAVGSNYIGLRMKPLEGYIYSASNQVDSETDFQWQEDARTHITINIHNAVIPNKGDALTPNGGTGLDTTSTTIPLIRVMINGDIEREVRFAGTNKEEFCTASMSNGGITLGQSGADLDVYSIRCYTNMKLETSDVVKDYISTLPTTAEKQKMRKDNDILTGEKVDVEKVKELGKRVLILHGVEPYMYNQSAQKVWWEIFQYNADGSYNADLSGTICKATKTKSKRQGSTANTYYYSNIQTKVSDGGTITVALADIHSSINWVLNDPVEDEETGEVTRTVSIYGGNLGAKDPVENSAKEYAYVDNDGVPSVEVPDGWIDGNGKYRGKGYMITEGTPLADKLVLKINYASSMQSHLCGCTRLYNDLHTSIVGKNSMQQACADNGQPALVAKYTEPVFFFTQAEDSTDVVYRGNGTFGGGKMDKPSWGYNKKVKAQAMFAMFEGSDNNYELTDMRVPFTLDSACSEVVTYSPSDEGYFYNGLQNLDFDGGATTSDSDGNESPASALTDRLAEIWNFLYLHAPKIDYYYGTFEEFQLSDEAKNTTKKYWCAQGSEAYKLKRYDFVDSKWVDAGLWNSETKTYEVVDLTTDEMTAETYANSENQTQYAQLNVELKSAIINHAKKYIGWYVNTKSLRFHYAFINHFMAGTDNCSKNTYYVFDPKAKEVTIDGVTKSCVLMELHQDDVDTILPIDNNGRKTKPYYIDRMNPYAEDDTAKATSLYEGMNNVLFNLCEEMYEGTRELQSMLNTILSTMTKLVSDDDDLVGYTGSVKVSAFGCLWKYMFNIQQYFPVTAFNEQARIRYEYPAMLKFISQGSGARAVSPITQSNGSLLQAELQFVRRRLIYMASYAAWGEFYNGKEYSIGISDATDSFAMQAYHLPDSATSATEYKFNVKPHQYIYPTGMLGQTSVDPHVRVAPDEEYTLVIGTTTSNDTGLSIMGINYYHSIGNIGDLSTSPKMSMTISGKRLTEFVAEPSQTYIDMETGESVPAFRPQSINVTATRITNLSLKGCVGVTGTLDLSEMTLLESFDISDTAITSVILPTGEVLKSISLPATLTTLTIGKLPNLKTIKIQGVSQLASLVLAEGVSASQTLFNACFGGDAPLRKLSVTNVNWTGMKKGAFTYLMNIKDCDISGKFALDTLNTDNTPTFIEKLAWLAKWGNVDNESNSVYIYRYTQSKVQSITVTGDPTTFETGDYVYTVNSNPTSGNDVSNLEWELETNVYASIKNYSANTCTINVKALGSEEVAPTAKLTCRLTKADGTVLEGSMEIRLYCRTAQLGDIVFADGTYGTELVTGKTPVGVCFYINPTDPTDRRMIGVEKLYDNYADEYQRTTNGLGSPKYGSPYFSSFTLTDEPGYNCFDIASLPNLEKSGLTNNTTTICPDTYLDENTVDGFKHSTIQETIIDYGIANPGVFDGKAELPADLVSLATGEEEGTRLPRGRIDTLKIIKHRNKILTDSGIDREVPMASDGETELNALKRCTSAIRSDLGSGYQQLYYFATSAAYSYQPTIGAKEKLSEKFKSHHWYLPSIGEVVRMLWPSLRGGSYTGNIGNIYKNASSLLKSFPNWGWMHNFFSSTESSKNCFWGKTAYMGGDSTSSSTGFTVSGCYKCEGGGWNTYVVCVCQF